MTAHNYLLAPVTDWGHGFLVGLSLGVLVGAGLVLAALLVVRAGREAS